MPEQTLAERTVAPQTGGTALLVDDNLDVLEVTSLYLQELGYEVEPTYSAKLALEAFASKNFSLVVSDIVMDGKSDGVDLAHAIRKIKPQTPIVLVTGYSQVAASISADFVLLRKPYLLRELSHAIGKAATAISRTPPGSRAAVKERRAVRRED